jgi:uncharacterized protein (DUF1501 family)
MFDVILGTKKQRCDGATRRDFLRVGALGAFGVSLGGVLAQEARAAGKKVAKRSVILAYLGGGLSHHDSFDPKPDATPEVRGNYGVIDTSVGGLQVSEKLPLMAQVMDKVALIRSGAHNNDHHETATNWVLSGRFGSAFGDYPAMGAVVAHETGFAGTLPPYVAIPRNPSFTWELGKSAFLGGRYESFKAGDPNAADYKVQDLTPAEPMTAQRAERRATLLGAVDGLARRVEGNDQIKTYDEFQQRAAAMLLSAEARNAFGIEQETDRLRERYGRTSFGQSCLLARRLVERGVRFVTINFGGWDHHAKIYDNLKTKLPDFDSAFSALITDLHERGLLGETLVLCMGEFGRTPKINKDAGRDHWGPAGSLLFAGAGVRGGLVLGTTDKQGAYVTKRPVTPADVCHTVFDRLGIDPRKLLQAPDGRPQEILDKGESINELFS